MTTVAEYLRDVKARLIADPLVLRFNIRRERQTRTDGHVRARLTLSNGDLPEFSEYVQQIEITQVLDEIQTHLAQ